MKFSLDILFFVLNKPSTFPIQLLKYECLLTLVYAHCHISTSRPALPSVTSPTTDDTAMTTDQHTSTVRCKPDGKHFSIQAPMVFQPCLIEELVNFPRRHPCNEILLDPGCFSVPGSSGWGVIRPFYQKLAEIAASMSVDRTKAQYPEDPIDPWAHLLYGSTLGSVGISAWLSWARYVAPG